MLKLSFQLFDNILIWNSPLVCPVILDSKLFLPNWAVVPAPEVIQPRLLIEHIPAIPKRLHLAQRFRQLASAPQRRTPRIVAVADDGIAILIQNRNNVALQALDVGIRRAIVHHHCRTVLRVVEEVQLVAALGHVDNVLAVQGVLTWP